MSEQIIKQERPDKVEIRQLAKGELRYTISITFDSNEPVEDFVERVNKFKDAVESKITI